MIYLTSLNFRLLLGTDIFGKPEMSTNREKRIRAACVRRKAIAAVCGPKRGQCRVDIEEGNKQLTAAAVPVALIRVHLPCICDTQTLDFHRIHSNIYRRQARCCIEGAMRYTLKTAISAESTTSIAAK
jgi:hypothetical protein